MKPIHGGAAQMIRPLQQRIAALEAERDAARTSEARALEALARAYFALCDTGPIAESRRQLVAEQISEINRTPNAKDALRWLEQQRGEVRNHPCAKIFEHKYLDLECVESGCRSLLIEQARREEAEAILGLCASEYAVQMQYGQGLAARGITMIEAAIRARHAPYLASVAWNPV